MECLKDAEAKGVDPSACTLVVTLEPCNHQGQTPPCTHFLALQDPNTGSILSLPGQSLLILTPGSAELAEGVYHR